MAEPGRSLATMFKNLKINVMIGAMEFKDKAGLYLNALREEGCLRMLEDQGIVKLEVFPMPVDDRMSDLNIVTPGNFYSICHAID
jgi:hypothetical protein